MLYEPATDDALSLKFNVVVIVVDAIIPLFLRLRWGAIWAHGGYEERVRMLTRELGGDAVGTNERDVEDIVMLERRGQF